MSCSRRIDIRYHSVRELVDQGKVEEIYLERFAVFNINCIQLLPKLF